MNAVLPEIPAVDPLPDCWGDHEVFGADGKAIKHVKRLLKPLRGLRAGILARASVGLNLRTGLAVAMVGHLDGEAGEAALTDPVAEVGGGGRPREAMGGGAGPTLLQPPFPAAGVESRGHFLIRYCTNTTFVPDPARPPGRAATPKGTGSFKSGVGWARLRRLAVSTCVGSPSICVTAKRSVWSRTCWTR